MIRCKCDFSALKTKVAHSPAFISLGLTLLYQVSKSFSICSEPDVISDLENQVFWVISFHSYCCFCSNSLLRLHYVF